MSITSRNVQGHTELTLIADLKTDLVPNDLTLSYATRLHYLLATFFGDRKIEAEKDLVSVGLLEQLQVIHSVRWAIIDNDSKLLLAVAFDGPWEPYIRIIVEEAGPLLDVIFSHCADYEGHHCSDGYEAFSAWVRSKQVAIPYLFAAAPDLTVDDLRYLKDFERTYAESAPGSFDAQAGRGLKRIQRKNEALEEVMALLGNLASVSGMTPPKTPEARGVFEAVKAVLEGSGPKDAAALKQAVVMGVLPPLKESAAFRRVYMLHTLGSEFFAIPGVEKKFEPEFQAVSAMILEPERGWLELLPVNAPGLFSPRENEILTWFRGLGQERARPVVGPQPTQNPETIQGNILTSYASKSAPTHGCIALLRFDGQAGGEAFLRAMAKEGALTWEDGQPSEVKANLALTYAGLETLGLAREVLESFPKEFQEGMAERAAMLGDVGANHPDRWEAIKVNWPPKEPLGDTVRLSMVDAMLFLQVRKDAASDDHGLLEELAAELVKRTKGLGVDVLHVHPTRRYHDRGHFGAVDGISQPKPRTAENATDEVALGELLLGYPNERGEIGEPLPESLCQNSTFVAIRKMNQDLWGDNELTVATKEAVLGRSLDGKSPLEPKPAEPNGAVAEPNDFNYSDPQSDQKCPLFSHVRRANPRIPGTPRILRRGMSYGPQAARANEERGLLFMAFASSLTHQFEVVQRWVNAGNATGVLSTHPDLVAGTFPAGSKRELYYRDQDGNPARIPLPPRPTAVLRWGLYGYVPSRSAIAVLADPAAKGKLAPSTRVAPLRPAAVPAEADTNARPPKALGDYGHGAPPLTPKATALKLLFEDPRRSTEARERWARVLAKPEGVESTEYAALFASSSSVANALRSGEYSVESYWARQSACLAPNYLGLDRSARGKEEAAHDAEADAANAFIRKIGFDDTFAVARSAALEWLGQKEKRGEAILELKDLGSFVIVAVANHFFGLPSELLRARESAERAGSISCPEDLVAVFAHVFPPRPSQTVSLKAVESGAKIAAAVEQHFEALKGSKLLSAIRSSRKPDPAYEKRTLIGVLSGFAVPTYGTFLSVMRQLISAEKFWRLQRDPSRSKLEQAVYGCMLEMPVPEQIHRTAVTDQRVGEVSVERGDLVSLNLGTAARQATEKNEAGAWKFLFGDTPEGGPTPLHACPGQDMAMGYLLGVLVALLEQPGLRRADGNPLALRPRWSNPA